MALCLNWFLNAAPCGSQGWLKVEQAIPAALCDAAMSSVWQFLGASPLVRQSWYRRPPDSFNPSPDQPGCHLLMFGTQAQWDIHTHPRLHAIFAELYGTEALWCGATGGSILMKPPADANVPLPSGENGIDSGGNKASWGAPHRLHFDINPHELRDGGRARPNGRGRGRIQAAVTLCDEAGTSAGGTVIVPRYHKLFQNPRFPLRRQVRSYRHCMPKMPQLEICCVHSRCCS